MKSGIRVAVAVLMFALAGTALAGTPRVDQRQENQDARIDQGVASGELNRREEARLEGNQQHIDNVENRALADGVVTGHERRVIERKQDRSSRRIARQKHDRQVRH
jgi:hypothetical protein